MRRIVRGDSHTSIAMQLSISLNTVSAFLFRCRLKLRARSIPHAAVIYDRLTEQSSLPPERQRAALSRAVHTACSLGGSGGSLLLSVDGEEEANVIRREGKDV